MGVSNFLQKRGFPKRQIFPRPSVECIIGGLSYPGQVTMGGRLHWGARVHRPSTRTNTHLNGILKHEGFNARPPLGRALTRTEMRFWKSVWAFGSGATKANYPNSPGGRMGISFWWGERLLAGGELHSVPPPFVKKLHWTEVHGGLEDWK